MAYDREYDGSCQCVKSPDAMVKVKCQRGFTLTEVMISVIILPISILGVTSMFQYANAGLQDGGKSAQALGLVATRVEAKRAVQWDTMLSDDLDADGMAEVRMVDDGTQGDVSAGDGIYTATSQRNGIQILWTIQSIDGGSPLQAGMVLIKARASYQVGTRFRMIETGTLRANPRYIGIR